MNGQRCLPGCTCNRHRDNGKKCEPGCTCARHSVAPNSRGGSRKCPADCTCSRHTATSRLPVEKKSQKCLPGCTCDRHSRPKDSYRSGSTKCEPGCTCARHKRVISAEHRANIVAANQARAGESHPCPPGCTCDRHQAHYRGGGKKCPPGCTCSKHTATSRLPVEKTGGKCEPGCTCGRHSAEARQAISNARAGSTLSDEHKAKIGEGARQMWANKTPEEMAEISRHRSEATKAAWARDREERRRKIVEARRRAAARPDRPRRPVSDETRQRMSESAKQRSPEDEAARIAAIKAAWTEKPKAPEKPKKKYSRSPEGEARRLAAMRASERYQNRRQLPVYNTEEYREKQRQATLKKWEDGVYEGRDEKTSATWAAKTPEEMAELSQKRSEIRKQAWADGVYADAKPASRRRTSNQERSLIPYLEKLGYLHNDSEGSYRAHIGRRVPDFVDIEGRRLFEYFGNYWHPDPAEEQELIEYYAKKGWSCTVLWESDLFTWLTDHEHLVTSEQHQAAWKAARINSRYRNPSSKEGE